METTIVGYIVRLENKMETTIMGYIGFRESAVAFGVSNRRET